MNYFCCCVPNIPPLKKAGVVVVPLLEEVPAAVLPNADDPKGDDCGVVVFVGVCPNENENAPDPEEGVPLGVVVIAAGLLDWLLDENEKLGVALVLVVLALGAPVVEVDVELPFPDTTLLGVSVVLPNRPPPNTF